MITIRVFLADDHPTLRMGLRVLLEQRQDICVIGESGNGRDALEKIVASQPTVAVLDCQLPEIDGIGIALELKRLQIPTKVMILSSYLEERYLRGIVDASILSYLLKDEPIERVIEAIHATANGQSRFSSKITQHLLNRSQLETQRRGIDLLTEGERKVVDGVMHGMTNKEIASVVGVSEKAVEKRLSTVFKKWQVYSRAEVAAIAARDGK